MALGLTIPGPNGGTPLVFTVKGQSAGNWTTDFSTALKNAAAINPVILSAGRSVPDASSGGTVTLNYIFSTGNPQSYTLSAGGEYTAALTGSATTVVGSTAGNDSVVGISYVTYDAVGGGNNVTFVGTENTYNGDSVGGDTVTGGEGFDTINTGTGNTTVFSGFGGTQINLNDTGTSSATGDIAFLGDGHATVAANGTYDVVITGVSGQLIEGGADSVSTLDVVIGSKTGNANFTGNNTVAAGAGTTNVFDSIGGNTIFGGTGNLDVIGGVRPGLIVADTVVAGTGQVVIFGASNNDFSFSSTAQVDKIGVIVAGSGNETLNAANAAAGVQFFGNGDSTASTTTNDTMVGGTYFNQFVTGYGNQAIEAGTGTNQFVLTGNGDSSTHITIFDFAAGNSSVIFADNHGSTDLNSGVVSNGNLTLTLNDGATVTFIGITSLSGHTV